MANTEKYYTILTAIGKAKIANAAGLGTQINFVTMKVGDGGGAYYSPTESQTDLVNTVWQGAITNVEIDEDNTNWINIEVLIPPEDGGFFIREYGVFDAAGNMLAIAKCAETYKPLPADGATKEITIKMVLAISNTSSITLKIDPTVIFAKKNEVITVDNKIGALSDLSTTNKTSIVKSINELAAQSSDNTKKINELSITKANQSSLDTVSKKVENLDNTKANKNTIWNMDNMGQDVKEAMTGGSVAVVGENSVTWETLTNDLKASNSRTVEKTVFNVDGSIKETYLDGNYKLTSFENNNIIEKWYLEDNTLSLTKNTTINSDGSISETLV